jgi:very-short-patch-repair endonuclease
MPEVNVRIEGLTVDAVWRRQQLVVELDGQAAHGEATSVVRDRDRELTLRAAGWQVLRYSWRQVTREPGAVAIDLRASLVPSAASSA